jgi:hypothetical protein
VARPVATVVMRHSNHRNDESRPTACEEQVGGAAFVAGSR